MSQSYSSKLEDLAANGSLQLENLRKLLCKPEGARRTKVIYLHRILGQPAPRSVRYDNLTATDLVNRVETDLRNNDPNSKTISVAVCMIENISPYFIETLGTAWNIDPEFFAEYASGPSPDHMWDHRSEDVALKSASPGSQSQTMYSKHLYGVHEYHGPLWSLDKIQHVANTISFCDRHVYQEARGPIISSTTLSFCRVSPFLYLFLTDPPLSNPFKNQKQPNKLQHRQWHQQPRLTIEDSAVSLRFPCAGNKGGLWIPPVLFGEDSMSNRLDMVLCRHPWHIELITSRPEIFPGIPFLYMLACSLAETITIELDAQIKHASFIEIRRPSWDMTDRLHEFRQQLSTLQAAMKETASNEPASVEDFFEKVVKKENFASLNPRLRLSPKERIRKLLEEAAELRSSILETFDLLISTIAVLDSKESKKQTGESLKQTRQSILLTSLATIYLPLSLATSVFGMNLLELVGSGPPVWVFVVTALALIFATVLVFTFFWRGNIGQQSVMRLNPWQRKRYTARNDDCDNDEKT